MEDIRSALVDHITVAGIVLLRLAPETKMALFLRFRRGTENGGFIRIINFFSQKYFKQQEDPF